MFKKKNYLDMETKCLSLVLWFELLTTDKLNDLVGIFRRHHRELF